MEHKIVFQKVLSRMLRKNKNYSRKCFQNTTSFIKNYEKYFLKLKYIFKTTSLNVKNKILFKSTL